MKSKVFLIKVKNQDTHTQIAAKVKRLLEESRVLEVAAPGDKVAVKLHFGEQGNTGFVKPAFVRVAVDALRARKARPFLSDTNTLYAGRRINSAEHTRLAHEHGFTPSAAGAEVIIPDDTQGKNTCAVSVQGEYVQTAKVARIFTEAQALVGIAHFKGHLMAGFGGALKNIGMGCATREGKLFQHSDLAPFVVAKKCKGCKACTMVCPAKAIAMRNTVAVVDSSVCIGCASCIAACKYHAIDLNWESGGNRLQEKMVEYAQAILAHKKKRSAFLNFCIKITQECDCLAKDDPRIVDDIGILASSDPVAIDRASYDLVLEAAGRDIFKELHPKREGSRQLEHAQKLGLGNLVYELTEVVAA